MSPRGQIGKGDFLDSGERATTTIKATPPSVGTHAPSPPPDPTSRADKKHTLGKSCHFSSSTSMVQHSTLKSFRPFSRMGKTQKNKETGPFGGINPVRTAVPFWGQNTPQDSDWFAPQHGTAVPKELRLLSASRKICTRYSTAVSVSVFFFFHQDGELGKTKTTTKLIFASLVVIRRSIRASYERVCTTGFIREREIEREIERES